MKMIKLKSLNKFMIMSFAVLNIGCVMTPDGSFVTPDVAGTDIEASVNIAPRVFSGSRSSVRIWLHPQYQVNDAYIVAQRHCSRWGLWADPFDTWANTSISARYLNYHCIGRRPSISYRNNYYHRPRHRRWRHSDRVYTPEPPVVIPRRPRRRTFGGSSGSFGNHSTPHHGNSNTGVEVGKPWSHKKKRPLVMTPSPRKPYVKKEIGKPWGHNTNKRKKVFTPSFQTPKFNKPTMRKRRTFGKKSALSL